MGLINEYLRKIKEAIYGEEVRSSIHDAIEQCYKDATGHPDSVAAVVERLKIEKGRIDELATSQTFTGNYTQSNLVFHAYRNATTGDPDPDDSYNYEGTSGKHEMPICKIFQEGTLDFAEKQSNEKVKILKEGLYIFELRIFISGSGKLDIEARINDVSQRYNAWQIVAQSTEETKIIAYILYLKGDDVVSFYGTPGLQASVRAPVSDVNCYVLDWIGKAQISDCSKEISDIRVGEDGTVYGSAGEATRTQFANLKEFSRELTSDVSEKLLGIQNLALINKLSNSDGFVIYQSASERNKIFVKKVSAKVQFRRTLASLSVYEKSQYYTDAERLVAGGKYIVFGVTSDVSIKFLDKNGAIIDDTVFCNYTVQNFTIPEGCARLEVYIESYDAEIFLNVFICKYYEKTMQQQINSLNDKIDAMQQIITKLVTASTLTADTNGNLQITESEEG